MSDKSLFAILLRSPWWISFAVAGLVALLARLVLPANMVVFGVLAGFPFVVVGGIAAWRQFHAPSSAKVAAILDTAAAMSWREFSACLEEAFRRDGCLVQPLQGVGADFVAAKVGSHALVSGKRWKAAKHGVEPLRELDAARQAHGEAREAIYVALGGLSDNALRFAAEHHIRILQGAALAQLLQGVVLPKKV